MTWGYLGWSLVAAVLALATSELLRQREKRRREALLYAAFASMWLTVEALKRATRSKK